MIKQAILEILLEGKINSGTCYQDAVNYMQDNVNPKLRLIHGLVDGQGTKINLMSSDIK